MVVRHGTLHVPTEGHGHVLDLTGAVGSWIAEEGLADGILTVTVPGSTAAITTIEYEGGALKDLEEALERIAPSGREYHHDRRWGDGNGFSHLRAALIGPSLSLPVASGRMVLGTWQQLVLVECDNRPRRREIALCFVGEAG